MSPAGWAAWAGLPGLAGLGGTTERKLVRRKKNVKIRPKLTLIAFQQQTGSMSAGDNVKLDGN